MKDNPSLDFRFLVENNDKFEEPIKNFELKLWFGGLVDKIRESSVRGHAAVFKKLTIQCYCIAGRVMFTFRDGKGDWVSTVVAETSRNDRLTMGLQSTSVEPDNFSEWFKPFIDHFNADMFNEDKKVNIL